MLNIAFRADSSHLIGTGHIMRCLTLAKAISQQCTANIYFFTRPAAGNINHLIEKAGFHLIAMVPPSKMSDVHLDHSSWLGATQAEDASEFLQLSQSMGIEKFDFIIVDHYAIDHLWQKKIAPHSNIILVIDDLGDRHHHCHLLLDQAYNCPVDKYQDKVPEYCQLLLGSQFTLLREEFRIDKQLSKKRIGRNIKKLLVMFGGTDPHNLTLETLLILENIQELEKINIILGETAEHQKSVQAFVNQHPHLTLHIGPSNIAQLMLEADLAIGSAGTASWERCATGLATIIIIDGENQRENANQLQRVAAASCIEEQVIQNQLKQQCYSWISNKEKYNNAIMACLAICDGLGSQRVANALLHVTSNPKT